MSRTFWLNWSCGCRLTSWTRTHNYLETCGKPSADCIREQTEPLRFRTPDVEPLRHWVLPTNREHWKRPEDCEPGGEAIWTSTSILGAGKVAGTVTPAAIRVEAMAYWGLENRGAMERGFCRDCRYALLEPHQSNGWREIVGEAPEHVNLYCRCPEWLDPVHGMPRLCVNVLKEANLRYCPDFKRRER